MDTEFPPPRPIMIEISSDTEPVKCEGIYCSRADGFALEFGIGQDKYTVEHEDARTVFCCVGKNQSYTLVLRDGERTQMRLETVYGRVDYDVTTNTRDVVSDGAIDMELDYDLIASGELAAKRKIRLKGSFEDTI